MSRKLIAVLVLILVAIGAYTVLRERRVASEKPAQAVPRLVKTMMLSAGDDSFKRSYPGKVLASQRVDLSFRVAGTLMEMPTLKGQKIAKGDLVGRLDPRDFDTQLQNAKSSLDNAKAQLAAMKAGARKEEISQLSSQVASAKARMDEAETNFKRMESLLKSGAVAKATYDQAKTAYDVARAATNTASQELQKARAGSRKEDVDAMEATIKGLESKVRAAQSAREDTELRAPFSGIVVDRYVENFQSVQKDQPVVTIQNLSELEVVIALPEQDMIRSKAAGAIEMNAQFDALPEHLFPLYLKEASTLADPQTQTYAITFGMSYPDGLLVLPGMTATVQISASNVPQLMSGFAVPSAAVVAEKGEKHSVWRLEGEPAAVRSVPVTIVGYNEDTARVSGDLHRGDRIVVAGTQFLAEGEKVRPYRSASEQGKAPSGK